MVKYLHFFLKNFEAFQHLHSAPTGRTIVKLTSGIQVTLPVALPLPFILLYRNLGVFI